MALVAAGLEFNAITDLQQEIHNTQGNEEIISRFYHHFTKSTWSSSVLTKLQQTQDSNETIYTVNGSFHYLQYTYMKARTPALRVKAKYAGLVEIALCHNPGSNITRSAVFKADDVPYHEWDSVWYDIYYQFYEEEGAGKRELHNQGVGNVACLQEFSSSIPAYSYNIDQPWFYSYAPELSFPIFYRTSQSRIEHRYTLRKNAFELVRIRYRTTAQAEMAKRERDKDVPWNYTLGTTDLSQYIETVGQGSSKDLPIPELWGRYALVTPSELTWHKQGECKEDNKAPERPDTIMYFRGVLAHDATNPVRFKSNESIKLTTAGPTLAAFWLAQNALAVKNHNLSNYTTNSIDLLAGWDPIKTTTLRYGTVPCFEDMASDHFNIGVKRHFRSAPSERGYHAFPYAWNSMSLDGDTAASLGSLDANLNCRVENTDIFLQEDDDPTSGDGNPDKLFSPEEVRLAIPASNDEEQPTFNIKVRLLILRRLTISATKGPDGGQRFDFKVE